jgi:hypothetical protein
MYLLGSNSSRYQQEIPNTPVVQPKHIPSDQGFLDEESLGGSLQDSSQERSFASLRVTNPVDEPMLHAALSRRQREEHAKRILQGKRDLVPTSMPSSRPTSRPTSRPFTSPISGSPTKMHTRTNANTTSPTQSDKIITSVFNPRYPADDAPKASQDFIKIGGGRHLLPISHETPLEASVNEKLRLLHKTAIKIDTRQMEDMSLQREAGMMDAMRLRKARLAADQLERVKSLEKLREEEVERVKTIHENRDAALREKREQAKYFKSQDILLKKIARKLRSDPRIGMSPGFSQCLRTCTSSEGFITAMLEEEDESKPTEIETNPETTFTTTMPVNVDVDDFIAPAGEDDDRSHTTFGVDSQTIPASLLSDYVDYIKLDPNNPEDLQGLAQLSVDSYTLDSMSYSAASPGGGSYIGGSPVGFRVRKPKLKKLGAGFLVKSGGNRRRKVPHNVGSAAGTFDIQGTHQEPMVKPAALPPPAVSPPKRRKQPE